MGFLDFPPIWAGVQSELIGTFPHVMITRVAPSHGSTSTIASSLHQLPTTTRIDFYCADLRSLTKDAGLTADSCVDFKGATGNRNTSYLCMLWQTSRRVKWRTSSSPERCALRPFRSQDATSTMLCSPLRTSCGIERTHRKNSLKSMTTYTKPLKFYPCLRLLRTRSTLQHSPTCLYFSSYSC